MGVAESEGECISRDRQQSIHVNYDSESECECMYVTESEK